MNEKATLRRKIWELDFALHELVLFLDTHPTSSKALELMREYRKLRNNTAITYESKYGSLDTTVADIEPNRKWEWIDGPWPWEICFTEE